MKIDIINSAAHNNRTRTHIPDQMTIKRWLSLSLFVLRILTDYSDASFSLDDFALFANRFYWWSHLHGNSPFYSCIYLSRYIGTAGLILDKLRPASQQSRHDIITSRFLLCKCFSKYFLLFFIYKSGCFYNLIYLSRWFCPCLNHTETSQG